MAVSSIPSEAIRENDKQMIERSLVSDSVIAVDNQEG